MSPRASAPAQRRIALRCDGDERIGAGHVARCLPLAGAFSARGHEAVLVGNYTGLAAWMIAGAGVRADRPSLTSTGVRASDWDAAVFDSYDLDAEELCSVACKLPSAFMAEAVRCPTAGVHIDYHPGHRPRSDTAAALAGPAYTPVDPRFAEHRRARDGAVRAALVTVGGSAAAHRIVSPVISALRGALPGVRIHVASGALHGAAAEDLVEMPYPASLLDGIDEIDIAVTAAGLTASELAAAGIPSVLVAVAPNQERVVRGFAAARAGIPVLADDPPQVLMDAVARLADPAERARLAAAAPALVDGRGAARAAAGLERRWGWTRPGG